MEGILVATAGIHSESSFSEPAPKSQPTNKIMPRTLLLARALASFEKDESSTIRTTTIPAPFTGE
jgi:hypothetical protein